MLQPQDRGTKQVQTHFDHLASFIALEVIHNLCLKLLRLVWSEVHWPEQLAFSIAFDKAAQLSTAATDDCITHCGLSCCCTCTNDTI